MGYYVENSFANWARGNRVTQYAGLRMSEGVPIKFGADYAYVEVPVETLINAADGSKVEKALRNQSIVVIPACVLDVRGMSFRVQVEPNPALSVFGPVQSSYYIHPGSGVTVPSFYVYPRKDFDTADLQYAVRLYLRA